MDDERGADFYLVEVYNQRLTNQCRSDYTKMNILAEFSQPCKIIFEMTGLFKAPGHVKLVL